MKYIIFSDVHGNGLAFDSFLEDIKEKEYDELIFLGDFIGYYYDAERIIKYCMENNVKCLLGNHDSYYLDMIDGNKDLDLLVSKYGNSYVVAQNTISQDSIDFLRNLDLFNIIELEEGGQVYLCHGSPENNLEGRIYPDADLSKISNLTGSYEYIICGHTHHRMSRFQGGRLYLNPGSLGQQRDGRGCSYLSFDSLAKTYEFHVIYYDIEQLEMQVDKYDPNNSGIKKVLRRSSSAGS